MSQNHKHKSLMSLTLTQQDIYFDQLHHIDSPLYNVGGYIQLGRLDVKKITHAHKLLVQNHDAYGLRIVTHEGSVQQYISDQRSLDLPLIDFSQASAPDEEATQWLSSLFATHLEIEDCELFRAYLVKLSADRYHYIGFAHHLVMDGWGFANWATTLGHLYHHPDDVEPGKPWQSVVNKELEYQQSARYTADKAFWSTQLQNLPEGFLIPHYKKQFQNMTSIPSARALLKISSTHHQALCQQAKSENVSISQMYMMIVVLYFSKVYQKSEFLLGTPAHNRRNHTEKSTIGVFTSVSPFRVSVEGTVNIGDFLRQLGRRQKINFRHQRYPIGQMQRDLGEISTDQGLYDIAYNYLKLDSDLNVEGEKAPLVYLSHHNEQTPIMITLWEYGDSQDVQMQLDHNLAYFSAEDIDRMMARLDWMIQQLAEGKISNTEQLSVLSDAERQEIHQFSNGQRLAIPRDVSVHQLFEQQVNVKPEAVAVSCSAQQLSYFELNQQANQLAHYLRAKGVKPADLVGVSLSRSCQMVVAVLAIIKTGACYIPLDPSYPQSRIEYFVADSGIKVVVSESAHSDLFGDILVVDVADSGVLAKYSTQNPAVKISDNQRLYVIYTSGSTGKPKGVEVSHANVSALIHWAKTVYSDDELAKVLVSTSLNFDVSVFEIFVPLSFGHHCVVVDDALSLTCQSVDVSLINTVPSAIKALLAHNAIPDSVKTINLGGEQLSAAVVNDLLRSNACERVFNLYGPSEDTVYSTYAMFDQVVAGAPVIGQVIANSQAWVLSTKQQILPVGAVGELCLAGAGVAIGYLNKDKLSAERFIDNPMGSTKLYRTGDLARYRNDGQLEFLGRMDDQVKIRGFRIELGEVEYHITRILCVNEVVVSVWQDQLIAYVCLPQVDCLTVQQALQKVLPDYMVPTSFICIEELPLTANGKVNKSALKVPDNFGVKGLYISPVTKTEQALAQIWAELLTRNCDKISCTANFFTLGGHSLLMVQLSIKIGEEFGVSFNIKSLFSRPTIVAQGQFIDQQAQSTKIQKIKVLARGEDTFALSPAQQRLWLVTLLDPSSTQYHMSATFKVRGDFDVALAEQAINGLISRHESLRTTFVLVENVPMQKVNVSFDFALKLFDFTRLSPDQQYKRQQQLINEDCQTAFDLSSDVMIRASYIALNTLQGEQEGVLLFTLHHIAADGFSLAIITDEFRTLYLKGQDHQPTQLRPLSVQYVDYAHWLNERLQSGEFSSQRRYWKLTLDDIEPLHSLPLDFARGPEQDHRGAVVQQVLSPLLVAKLQQLALDHSMTLFMVLHGALAMVILRHSEGSESVIGTPVANRMHPSLATLVGCFVNTVVLRTNSNFATLTAYLAHIRQINLDAQANQDIPFEQIVEQCQLPPGSRYSPLFQIMFSMNTNKLSELSLPGVDFEPLASTNVSSKFDLDISAQQTPDGLVVDWTYALSLFDRVTIETLSDHFAQLLDSMLNFPERAPVELPMLAEAEVERLLYQLNDNYKDVAKEKLIHQLFEQHALNRPNSIALVFEQKQLSYQTLNQQANQLAHFLLQHGIGIETPVAVCMTLSEQMIVALLAVFKVGGVYVPLDSSYPAKRLEFMLRDIDCQMLLSTGKIHERLELSQSMQVVELDDDPIVRSLADLCSENPVVAGLNANNLAYIIYTSGSTGQPKGVCCEHHSILNLVADFQKRVGIGPDDRCSLWTSISFDVSIYEIFSAFGGGCTLYLVPELIRVDSLALFDWLRQNQISSAYIPAFYLNELSSWSNDFGHELALRRMLVGVEPILTKILSNIQAKVHGVTIINGYGPSEATVCSSLYQIDHFSRESDTSITPIGRPVINSQLYVVDPQFDWAKHSGNCLVPFGTVGELYIGGAGLARNYWHDQCQSFQRFITNPFNNVDRWYRTGDLVRYLPDGNLMFAGRVDEQIKLRGFRIELGEIEKQLVESGLVHATVVVVQKFADSNNVLVAYCVACRDQTGSNAGIIAQLKQCLMAHLPDYMVPPHILLLDALPMTANGKVDKKALPLPDLSSSQAEYCPPNNLVQKQLIEIWSRLLKLPEEQISIKANFFELGGHSLLGARLMAEIDNGFGLKSEVLGIKDIFASPILATMASRLEGAILIEKYEALAAQLEVEKCIEEGEI